MNGPCSFVSAQSQFSYPFKHLVGVTPRQFRRSFWPQEQRR
jgi:AraC-like DNA-binding protein